MPIASVAQKMSASKSNRARSYVKTSRCVSGRYKNSWSNPCCISIKTSRSLGNGLAVTKLPQINVRSSFPVVRASVSNSWRRLANTCRRGVSVPKRVRSKRQSNVYCITTVAGRISTPNCDLTSDPLPRGFLRGALKRRPLTMSSTVYLARQSRQDILRGQVSPSPL